MNLLNTYFCGIWSCRYNVAVFLIFLRNLLMALRSYVTLWDLVSSSFETFYFLFAEVIHLSKASRRSCANISSERICWTLPTTYRKVWSWITLASNLKMSRRKKTLKAERRDIRRFRGKISLNKTYKFDEISTQKIFINLISRLEGIIIVSSYFLCKIQISQFQS